MIRAITFNALEITFSELEDRVEKAAQFGLDLNLGDEKTFVL